MCTADSWTLVSLQWIYQSGSVRHELWPYEIRKYCQSTSKVHAQVLQNLRVWGYSGGGGQADQADGACPAPQSSSSVICSSCACWALFCLPATSAAAGLYRLQAATASGHPPLAYSHGACSAILCCPFTAPSGTFWRGRLAKNSAIDSILLRVGLRHSIGH